jgi:hypothetical protein
MATQGSRVRNSFVALSALLFLGLSAHAQTDPLPSWNDGAAKKAIVGFVQATTAGWALGGGT